MIIHNSAQPYTRPMANIGIHQTRSGKKTTELLGWLKPTQGTGRLALVICLATVAVNLAMGGYSGHLSSATAELENHRHELIDQNITLRAMRASMMTPLAIERVAGEKLALQKADANQILVFNSSKRRFETLQ